MRVFVDTSAYYSLLDKRDSANRLAHDIWDNQLGDARLVTSNYVVTEAISLVQNRLGMAAVADLNDIFFSLTHITWIDETIHVRSIAALLTANRRQLSLVDCTSFEICRQLGIDNVFAFDRHFREQGFVVRGL